MMQIHFCMSKYRGLFVYQSDMGVRHIVVVVIVVVIVVVVVVVGGGGGGGGGGAAVFIGIPNRKITA